MRHWYEMTGAADLNPAQRSSATIEELRHVEAHLRGTLARIIDICRAMEPSAASTRIQRVAAAALRETAVQR
mgnify:CR=1 FL=1